MDDRHPNMRVDRVPENHTSASIAAICDIGFSPMK
jgi:hypothetical protein